MQAVMRRSSPPFYEAAAVADAQQPGEPATFTLSTRLEPYGTINSSVPSAALSPASMGRRFFCILQPDLRLFSRGEP